MSEQNRKQTASGKVSSIGAMEKSKDFKGTMTKLIGYLKPYMSSIIAVVIFAVGSAGFGVIGPKILGKVTTKIFEGLVERVTSAKGAGIDFANVSKIVLLLLGLYIISAIFSFIQGYIISGVAQKTSYALRKEISEKINRLPLKYFDTKTHGELLSRVTISILGGWLTIKKTIAVGDILAFIQYVNQFNQPVSQLAQISNALQSTVAAAERVFEFLEEKEEILESNNLGKIEKITGEVIFKDVHFGYNADKLIINDFSASIKPGQRVAIVGPTGAGKTTIVKLLMRFYDVFSGAILIDGNNIKDFKRNKLRSIFGMVLQDTWLFNGSIMENIRYGRLDASDEEVIKAAKAAHAHHFIKTLPDGYNMILNEDASNVSQGQKQLITIARAILASPKILILDEATSSVDTRTEVRLQKAMDNLMHERTSFIIAHRLSTIRDADVILVMNDGDIVEQGNHDELIVADGFYASLYKSQFEVSQVS